jgi:deazaflavin-dependent oxidoreductase (nitroreductase family)
MTPVEEQLQRVADFERQLRATPFTRVLRGLGRTRGFAFVYRRFGPKADPWLLHRSQGRFVSRFFGLPALLITTTGARSGQPREMPLLYLRDGDDFVVVGTNFGQHHHPGWTANLLKHPDAVIEVGPERLPVTGELAGQETWDRLWPRFVEMYPGYADYLGRTGGRVPRMFLLHPTG